MLERKEYIRGWHIDVIAEFLTAVLNGEVTRLIINIPPRHMKSLLVSVFFPAWCWLHRPEMQFLCASYAERLSIRDNVKCRRVIENPKYQLNWGMMAPEPEEGELDRRVILTKDQNQKTKFENIAAGYRTATSVDGLATGDGGDCILVDDPHNVKDTFSLVKLENVIDWWDEVMQSRLNDPDTGAKIIIMQRVHENDLTGHILEREHTDDEIEGVAEDFGYEHLCLPAEYEGNRVRAFYPVDEPFQDPRTTEDEPLWATKFGTKVLAGLKSDMTEYAYAGQYQQRPSPRGGGAIKKDDIKIITEDQLPPKFDEIIRFWDLAATIPTIKGGKVTDPDFTAGALMAAYMNNVYLLNVVDFRKTPGGVEDKIRVTTEEDGFEVNVRMEEEGGASGKNTTYNYGRYIIPGYNFKGIRSTGSKESYIERLASAAENGRLFVLKGPWNKGFIYQATTFPACKKRDIIDATAKAYCQLKFKLGRAGAWGRGKR